METIAEKEIKDLFRELVNGQGRPTNKFEKVSEKAHELAEMIVNDEANMISVGKKRFTYGCWRSYGHANRYYFGEELAELIEKALHSSITHEEDTEYSVPDFEQVIAELIIEKAY